MAVNLTKGQKVDITKNNPGLQNVVVGVGWDVNRYDGGHDFDLDVAGFMLDGTARVTTDTDFIFFNNPEHTSGALKHLGDNTTGAGDGDDEQIIVKLGQMPSGIERVAFTVTIHDAEARSQNFGQVSNAYIRVFNGDTNEELIRYDLSEDFSIETALVLGELYKHNNDWKFTAVGSGFEGGLSALCTNFGISV